MQKRDRLSNLGEKNDRLSNLPDDVRNLIVSLLPVEEAMRTTILSRKWRFCRFSFPNMEFNQSNFVRKNAKKGFGDFVDHILERYNESIIEQFYITVKCGINGISTRRIHQWISFAVCHRVRKLNFEDLLRKLKRLPCCLFTCTTLTSLKLCFIILKSPVVFSCPSLKMLNLERVEFVYERGSTKTNLSVNCDCPLLESLLLEQIKRSDTLAIFAPAAKYVRIGDICDTHGIILSLPNLHEIDYTGFTQPNFTSETLSSLVKAKFVLLSYYGACPTTKAMMGFWNVESLSLGEYYMKILTRDQALLSPFPSTYFNLRELEVDLFPVMEEVLLVTSLLRFCPNLLVLKIWSKGFLAAPNNLMNMERHCASEIHDGYMLKHLKDVYIYSICGLQAELYLIRYLLLHATMMEKIRIIYTATCEDNYKRIRKKLESFTKASPCVEVSVSSLCSFNKY